MCGSSKALAARIVSRPTAWAAKATLLLSKRSRPPTPRRLSRTNAANRPKRTYSALRIAALVVCGMITALTTPEQRIARLISRTRQIACMKAPSGWLVAGMPISVAV